MGVTALARTKRGTQIGVTVLMPRLLKAGHGRYFFLIINALFLIRTGYEGKH